MTDGKAQGRIAQLAQALHQHLPLAAGTSGTPQAPHEVYQYSTLEALLGGVYDGDVTIGELLAHGDFGLGTFNSLDGEMIILDGICYHLRSDGTAAISPGSELTPFAAVTYFRPRTTFTVATPTTYQHLDDLVSEQISSHNLNYALRITGQFSTVRTRTVARQTQAVPAADRGHRGASRSHVHRHRGNTRRLPQPQLRAGDHGGRIPPALSRRGPHPRRPLPRLHAHRGHRGDRHDQRSAPQPAAVGRIPDHCDAAGRRGR